MATTREMMIADGGETRALRSATLTGESIPRRVLLAPWGQVESTNGSFVVDDEAVALAIEAFAKHGTDLPIDYEHQTLGGTYSSPTGQAPAAGWVKGLLAEPGVGLVAQIEWTEQAEKMLAAKEYRYLSPVAIIRKRDRKLVAVHSAALTNKPAIVGMQPIVNRVGAEPGDHNDEPLASLRAELDLPSDTGPEEMLVAAGRRLADLRQQSQQRHIEQRIAEAVRAGKLVEAQRAWAEDLVAREEGLFDEWFRTAPVVIQTGASLSPEHSDSYRRHSTAARARAEFSSNPTLGCLTTEEAYVADALRRAG